MGQGIIRTVAATLRERPALLAFPLVTVAGWAVPVAVAWLTPLSGAWDLVRRGHAPTPAQDAGLSVLLLVLSFVSLYGNAALLLAVYRLRRGERPPVPAVLADTARRLPVLLRWFGVRTTVGLVLRALESVGLGGVFAMAAGFAWSMVAYFALPVLLVENGPMLASLRRSGTLAKRRGGDSVAGTVRAVLIAGVALILAIAALILGVRFAGTGALPVVLAVVVAGLLLLALALATASGVYRMSLYLRAVTPRPRVTAPERPHSPAADAGRRRTGGIPT